MSTHTALSFSEAIKQADTLLRDAYSPSQMDRDHAAIAVRRLIEQRDELLDALQELRVAATVVIGRHERGEKLDAYTVARLRDEVLASERAIRKATGEQS